MESSGDSIGRATLLIILSALSFGSISVLTVLVTGAGVPLLTAMAWRYLLGAILLVLSPNWVGFASFQPRRVIQLVLIGGCGQALITYSEPPRARVHTGWPLAFLFYTYPAWVALLGALRKTERLTLVRIIALTLALAGVTIMVGAPTEKLNPIGVLLALALPCSTRPICLRSSMYRQEFRR